MAASTFADDPTALAVLHSPSALSWLLRPAPFPSPSQLAQSVLCEASYAPSPAPGPATAPPAPQPPFRTMFSSHEAAGRFVLGSYWGADETDGVFGALEEPVGRATVTDVMGRGFVSAARFGNGAVFFKSMAVDFGEEEVDGGNSRGEPETVTRYYLFDGFPEAEANGGAFPRVLARVVLRQKRQCPFCAANRVVCECPDEYKKLFLPVFDPPEATLASVVSELCAASAGVTFGRRESVSERGMVPFRRSDECFILFDFTTSSESVLGFAKNEFQKCAALGARWDSPFASLIHGDGKAVHLKDSSEESVGLRKAISAFELVLGSSLDKQPTEPLRICMAEAPSTEPSNSNGHDFLVSQKSIEPEPTLLSERTNFDDNSHIMTLSGSHSESFNNDFSAASRSVEHCLDTIPSEVQLRAILSENVPDSNSARSSRTDSKAHVCPQCGKSFERVGDCRRHIVIKHTEVPRKFVCPTCGDSFKQKWHLKSHVAVHSSKRPFKCLLCPLAFVRKSDLGKHSRVIHQKSMGKKTIGGNL